MTEPTVDDEQLWAAVGEPGRRRLLDLLVVHGSGTPTTLASEVPFSRQAVSKHLGVLEEAGLVTAQRAGREVRYTVDPDRLAQAVRTVSAAAARWDARLLAIKRISEELHRQHLPPR
jgi:DNA-binding transcriptional ArsR family regulator